MTRSIVPFTKVDDEIITKARSRRESLAERYPMAFAIIGTFGFVSTLYGFEKIIDGFPIFVDRPWILLVFGLATLSVTGLALRKLG